MITIEQAECIATDYLNGLQQKLGVPLQVVSRLDVTFGWVFFYNSKAYVQSGEIGAMLAGNAPFVVDILDGKLQVLGTAHPIEAYLQEYENLRKKAE